MTITIKSRVVTVEGPRGKLTRDFKHRSLEFTTVDDGKRVRVDCWFGKKKQLAALRTITSHVENMITGVTKGFEYKVRAVYAHFPIKCVLPDANTLEIRNFLGEKRVRTVKMPAGVTVKADSEVKDCLLISGNDVEKVGTAASMMRGVCMVKRKDIRKFLDGMYVQEKGHVVKAEA